MKINFLIFILFFTFSCQNNMTKPSKNEIKSTALSGNLNEWKDGNNNTIRQYGFSKRKPTPALYIPIASFFLPRHYENYEVVTVFDEKNKVISEEIFYNLAIVESEFFCNKTASNCLIKAF